MSHINFRFSDRRCSQSRALNHNRAVLEIFRLYWYCNFYVHGLYCVNNRNSHNYYYAPKVLARVLVINKLNQVSNMLTDVTRLNFFEEERAAFLSEARGTK